MARRLAIEMTGAVRFLGVVPDRRSSLRSVSSERITLDYAGIVGDSHSGLTRPSCSRVTAIYPVRGTPIRNTRQISLLSVEELAETARILGLPVLPPEWVGANLILEGFAGLTALPPASRLAFEGGAVLTVDVENAPCNYPAREIEIEHPGMGKGYKAAAKGRRGLTAWVEREGEIRLGETVRLHKPPH